MRESEISLREDGFAMKEGEFAMKEGEFALTLAEQFIAPWDLTEYQWLQMFKPTEGSSMESD